MEVPETEMPLLRPTLSKGESIVTHISVVPSVPTDKEKNLRNIAPVIL